MIQQPEVRSSLKIFSVAALALALTACGGGGSSSGSTPEPEVFSQPNIPVVDPASEIAIDPSQADLLDQLDSQPIGGDEDNETAPDNGDFIPAIFPTSTDLDLAYAQSGAALVEQLNESLVLPADIDVNFMDCGVANAFYVPPGADPNNPSSPGGSIIMCHELTVLFGNLFGDSEQAFLTSVFVLMHEVGHALVDQLNLPVLGIEEAYVDGVGAVFVGEAGLAKGAVLAGWFFFSQPESPFFDTHRVGQQRLGDLACWGIGADPSLLSDPTVANIAQQLVASGRNCVAEYQQQLDGLTVVLGNNIRGGLGDTLGDGLPAIVEPQQ